MENENYVINPIWHLHDDLSVDDASALIANEDPTRVEAGKNDFDFAERFAHVLVAHKALVNAINSGKLKATKRYDVAYRMTAWEFHSSGSPDSIGTFVEVVDEDDNRYYMHRRPNWGETTVDREDLRTWLKTLRPPSGFLFEHEKQQPDYLDPSHPRYASKLAASVRAWENYKEIPGKSPRQAMEKWLREHASEFGMVDEEGNPKKTPVEQCSEVANWAIIGGAPRTPQA